MSSNLKKSDLQNLRINLLQTLLKNDKEDKLDIHIYLNNDSKSTVFLNIDEKFNTDNNSLSFDFEIENNDYLNMYNNFLNDDLDTLTQNIMYSKRNNLHICFFDKVDVAERSNIDYESVGQVQSFPTYNELAATYQTAVGGAMSNTNVSFVLFPQTYTISNDDLQKWNERTKNIVDMLDYYINPKKIIEVPKTLFLKDFENFKNDCPRQKSFLLKITIILFLLMILH